ncbi:alpha-amylase family protein [Neorhodopirellula pilleata]|uniref:hypothetical protein n=1 Tax=Neorhodopirellula pilleata TaxID=2714738 RepID=UPI0011B6C80E|nr:hypothetical protein [Neorhodopirellula pilleata]
MESTVLVVSTTSDVVDGNYQPGQLSLREAIQLTNESLGPDTITFDPSVFDGVNENSLIRLSGAELSITDSLTIDASMAIGVTITGDTANDDVTRAGHVTDVAASGAALLDDNTRVLNFSGASGDLTLRGLTVTGGRTTGPNDDGGGIRFGSANFSGALTIDQSTVSGNSTTGSIADGGGVFTFDGDLTCHDMRVAPFLSYRLNDGHHVRQLQRALARGKPTPNMSRHYWENYERFRIGPNETEWDDGVFDWSIAEVQDHKFALIEEALANYDLTGLELDFLRHWVRFGPKTKIDKRREITTDFVRRIRKMLDKTARDRGLPRRWLCVRIPAKANVRGEQGVDLPSLAGAGVDMVNLSYSYFTMQDDSVRRAKAEINNDRVAVYTEMSHCTMTGKATAGSGTQPFLRTTDEQFYTTARLARKQGARGVSLFNFPYYRYHVTDTIGPFHEPPFHVIPRLGDDDFLTAQSHWYFLTAGRKDRVIAGHPLPTIVERSDPFVVTIEMLPTPKHRKNGLLRLRSDEDIRDREIEVNFNDVSLREIEFIEKPLPHRYDNTWLGKSEQTRCFRLPAGIARDGANQIKINVNKGIRVRLRYLDITLS